MVFDGFKAVDGLSLSVARDELRVIIGPNGAGKTTLLDMICGKTRPTSGRVMFRAATCRAWPSTRSCAPAWAASFRRPRSTRT